MRRSGLLVPLVACLALFLPVGPGATGASAGGHCASTPAGMAALPVDVVRCNGVQPGGRLASGCTLNFLFQGSDGHRYIGTAGHCIVPSGTETVWADGPEAGVAGARIGQYAYAVSGDGRDFALIRLDDDVVASASVLHFGGPTGLYESHESTPVVLHHYGHGSNIREVLPARSAVAPHTLNASRLYFAGSAMSGDSGSPIITASGEAAGVLTHLAAVNAADVPPSAGVRGTRIDHQLPFAAAALGIELTLQTAPLLTSGA